MALTTVNIVSGGSAVAPSDGTRVRALALWVGGAGDLRVEFATGEVETLRNVPAGALLPIEVQRVLWTGTTATHIVALR